LNDLQVLARRRKTLIEMRRKVVIALIRRNWQMYCRYFPLALFINRIIVSSFQLISLWLIAHILFDNKIWGSTEKMFQTSDYFTYATIGVLFYSLSVTVLMNVGRALITEVREGTLTSLLITPYKVLNYYIGAFVEQSWRAIIEFLALFVVALFLGANLLSISIFNWLIGICFVVLSSFCMSIFLSNIMLMLRDTFISQNTLFVLMFLVSGVTFPRAILPQWLQVIGNLIPITQILEVVHMLYSPDYNNAQIYQVMLIGTVSSVIYFIIGLIWYKKTEQKIIGYIFE
jgi:ABC-2 type transport system permease protein